MCVLTCKAVKKNVQTYNHSVAVDVVKSASINRIFPLHDD